MIFSLQDGGQCFTEEPGLGPEYTVYDHKKYGKSLDCSNDGEGGTMTNAVYEINGYYVFYCLNI